MEWDYLKESTPASGSSPALEWDTDDIMDPETSELLTEIDRLAHPISPVKVPNTLLNDVQ